MKNQRKDVLIAENKPGLADNKKYRKWTLQELHDPSDIDIVIYEDYIFTLIAIIIGLEKYRAQVKFS